MKKYPIERMDKLSQLLSRWGVSEEIIERFKVNRIRLDHLTRMTEHTLEKLIPIAGERLDFVEHLQLYNEKLQEQILIPSTAMPVICNDSTLMPVDTETAKISIITVQSDTASNELETSIPSSVQNELHNPSTSQTVYESPTKRLCIKDNVYDLSTLLQSSTSGKMVLAYFSKHASLNHEMRKILANEIMNNELSENINVRMPTERVEFLTEQITTCFPSEIKVMWQGAYGNKRRRESSVGRGILLQRYYSIRRKLRKCGILQKETSKHAAEHSVNSEPESDDEVTLNNVQWLKNNCKPWSKVQELWKLTKKNRLRLLHKEAIAIHNYMNLFPALKNTNGYLLLEQDFEDIYPNSTMKLYSEWPMFSAFIEKKLTNEKEIESINDSLTSEGRKIRTLLALNSLFTVITVLKKQKKQWRPTRQESREALLLLVKSANDIQPTLNLRREKYIEYGQNFGVQPVIVGANVDVIKHSFVIINDIYYEVETPFKAIDIAFKCMYALDCKYPTECARELQFLQQSIYDISTSDENICDLSVLTLIQEYQRFKANN